MLVKDQLQAVLANDTSMAMMFLIDIGSMQQAQILIFLKKKFFFITLLLFDTCTLLLGLKCSLVHPITCNRLS